MRSTCVSRERGGDKKRVPINLLRQQIRAELAESGLLGEGQIGLGR